MIGSRKSLIATYPHVDPTWMATFLMALRMRGVSGPRIGELMEDVADHCAITGAPADQAFGDPRDYAAALDHPAQDRAPALTRRRDVVQGTLMLGGAALAGWGGVALIEGHALALTVGQLAATGVTLLVFALVTWRLDAVLAHPWLALFGVCAAYVLPCCGWPATRSAGCPRSPSWWWARRRCSARRGGPRSPRARRCPT